MKVWVDPKETVGDQWGAPPEEQSDAEAPTPATPVMERAVTTRPPVQYRDGAFVTPTTDDRPVSTDGYARLEFDCAVTGPGRIKLTARGYHWGSREGDRRFKSLYTRAADPTDTVPFDTYERWMRLQRGDVVGFDEGDEYIDFRPDEGAVEESRTRRDWESLWWSIRLRLAELELVRNPAFARYVLRERGEWETVRDTLRWKPTAFGDAATE